MNQHLDTILNFIQQSKKLSADEKNNISKAVQKADDELEHKNRELEIEAGLERVRARAMAMHKTDELLDAAELVYKELFALGIASMAVSYAFVDEDEKYASYYGINPVDGKIPPLPFVFPHTETEVMRSLLSSWKKQDPIHVIELDEEATLKHQTYIGEHIQNLMTKNKIDIPFSVDAFLAVSPKTAVIYSFNFTKGYLFNIGEERLTNMQEEMVLRFTKVFDMTYRRFLDLKQAEAQAREAKIEGALEKVRGRAMAMLNSNDLSATASIVFSELSKLGIHPVRSGVGLLTKDSHKALLYAATASLESDELALVGPLDMSGHPCLTMQYESCLKKENYFPVLSGDELKSYYKELAAQISVPSLTEEQFRHAHYGYYLPFSEGYFYAWTEKAYSEDEINILNRFKAIIDLTFRRYLDLQKAEAQTREAQIELALERVRARSMAMYKSEELVDASTVLFNELRSLGIEAIRTGVAIVNETSGTVTIWSSQLIEEKRNQILGAVPFGAHPFFQDYQKSWKKKEPYFFSEIAGDELKDYYQIMSSVLSYPQHKEFNPKECFYVFFFKEGSLNVVTHHRLTEDVCNVMIRFARVFGLIYTRFLDLQLAEANAEKAQIEEQKLREEKKRSDSLLLNILPEEVANELKQFGKSYARKHEEVTILFADIKGFSSIAENLSADELVTQLDECFRAFDKIIEKHGLEKIKTVGDAYICACGLPKPVPDNAVKTVRAAMDMLDFLKGFSISKKIQNLPAFEFRVGIHTGPVVTGVVGLKKFTYDFWGDTVNMAARMEQHGEAGKINVSGNTYQFIKDKFTCTHRGKIQAKNKGEVDMYFVETVSPQ